MLYPSVRGPRHADVCGRKLTSKGLLGSWLSEWSVPGAVSDVMTLAPRPGSLKKPGKRTNLSEDDESRV